MSESFKSSRLYGFFCELKRRKVYRVAAGYGVVGWLVIQFATTVLPALTLPAWAPRFVIVLVLAGFPIALILAWALDAGPDGIHVTREQKPNAECPPAATGRGRNIFTLAIVGLLISATIGYFVLNRTSSRKARLSHLESWMFYAIEPLPARAQKARAAAEGALALQPDLPESHLAMGYVHYYIDRNYDAALSEFAIARAGLPNDPGIFRAMAAIQRRQGKWEESSASYAKAVSLDPKDPILLENMGMNYLSVRDYSTAAHIFDRAVKAAPETFTIRELRTRVDFYSKGDLRPLQTLLATQPENIDPNGTITLARYNLKMYERKFGELLGILDRSPAEKSRGETSAPISKEFLKATGLPRDERRGERADELRRSAREGRESGPGKSGRLTSPCITGVDLRRARPLRRSEGGSEARGRSAA